MIIIMIRTIKIVMITSIILLRRWEARHQGNGLCGDKMYVPENAGNANAGIDVLTKENSMWYLDDDLLDKS